MKGVRDVTWSRIYSFLIIMCRHSYPCKMFSKFLQKRCVVFSTVANRFKKLEMLHYFSNWGSQVFVHKICSLDFKIVLSKNVVGNALPVLKAAMNLTDPAFLSFDAFSTNRLFHKNECYQNVAISGISYGSP